MTDRDTICAVSTAPGTGGIAVIRVSGPRAVGICGGVFFPKKKGKSLDAQPPYTVCLGSIIHKGELIDEALATVFRSPHSYTGEDTVEITCHGSHYIQQRILMALTEEGCRMALPGEYTKRAFLGGKMDLSQAEAVADLIASTSAGMNRLALSQMRGGFGMELGRLRERLLDFASLIELELDFGEEDVEFADRLELERSAKEIERVIGSLAGSFSLGNVIKNGVPVAIVGQTNAGKSTLLNLLLGDERAIVSDIHGTTRDAIEDTVSLGGVTFRFIDTAGIRETSDMIESLGIERTFRKIEQASIVLWVVDLTCPAGLVESLSTLIAPLLEGKKTILLFNKSDLLTGEELDAKRSLLPSVTADRLYISAAQAGDIDLLRRRLTEAAAIPAINQGDIVVTNVRHYDALIRAQASIGRVIQGLAQNISGDFLSQDIRQCLHYIGEITGHITPGEILANIFDRFCIGK
ncbi:MAG: tRNA uridine-5-carboxymethylaminomethyl(34) synthesis GTPase MnmE [Tannerellaceae bacterium]|jgi:tRNA modification GTPase|nr:tRNA uridine-5-carboxymethylaminomethyl(34) synthesis GTPase MnmE [Tannerellaceae bacterium]